MSAPEITTGTEDDERHVLANQWTQRGIALLSSGHAETLPEALKCFETAIELRRSLPLEAQPWYRWGLTAGWMNRGDALTRMGSLREALASYEHALEHLMLLPSTLDPAVSWRLGLAWMNRALVLRELGPEHVDDAVRSVDKSIEVLSESQAESPRHRGTLGCAWANRAAVLMEAPSPLALQAQDAALRGRDLLRELEQQDSVAAEAGIKARHCYCQATAWLLETPPVDAKAADQWIMTGTDCVEEGLALYLGWREHLSPALGDLALQLFRFGCRIYLAYQPQFLAEFMLDVLNPEKAGLGLDAAFYDAADEASLTAARLLRQRGPAQLGTGRVEDVLHLLGQLSDATARLKEWRSTADR
ncbi:MAG TPA: hypothetical protein VD994_13500 [Prosthecobacter sp.]|nr:hypothetical protein [Prosthecobacter sp.]